MAYLIKSTNKTYFLQEDLIISHPFTECAIPVVPEHGKLVNQTGRYVGATASQLCDKGYKLSGSRIITCLEDGLWSEPPVTCIKIGNPCVYFLPSKRCYG